MVAGNLGQLLADPRAPGTRVPSGSNFFYFHAVFRKKWPNNRLVLDPRGLVPPPSAKCWIRHCQLFNQVKLRSSDRSVSVFCVYNFIFKNE